VGYYQTARFPKPEIRAVTAKLREKRDAQAERRCRAVTRKRDDGRCRVDGCRRSARHLHHITARSLSRRDRWATSRCVWLCVDHHRLAHAGDITIRGNADQTLIVTGDVDRLRRIRIPRRR
jgi:hypothetical protein